jgi:hypothetical protein
MREGSIKSNDPADEKKGEKKRSSTGKPASILGGRKKLLIKGRSWRESAARPEHEEAGADRRMEPSTRGRVRQIFTDVGGSSDFFRLTCATGRWDA